MPANLGTKHHASALSEEMVRTLRKEYRPYVMGYRKLGDKYKINYSTVRDCVQFYSYRNVY